MLQTVSGEVIRTTSGVARRALAAACAAVAAVAFAAGAAGIGVRASYGARVTGDEPYYLLTALSLARDGDIDISDEIASEAYRPFHEVDLDEQTRPLAGGRRVAPHDPLLPALLAPAVAAGGWVGAKLALCLMAAAAAAATLWACVRRFAVPLLPAGFTCALFAASAPWAVYANQAYPEIAAALACALGVCALTGPLRPAGVTLLGACVVALPWLSVKYAPVAAVLAGLGLARLWRERGPGAALVLAGALGLAGVVFAVAHLRWYGGLTPYAAGDHFVGGELTVVGYSPNFVGRARRLIGLLVDREFGLAAWQPAWLLAVPALAVLVRARPRGWTALTAPLAVAWLTATFVALTMHGWWWPGRQVVVSLPCAVVALAWWAARSRRRLAALAALGGAGVFTLVWVVIEGLAGELTWVIDFFETTAPTYRLLAPLLPRYMEVDWATWALQTGWLVVLGAGAARAWAAEDRRPARRPAASEPSGVSP